MSYGWFRAVVPVVSGLAIQRDGQSVDIRYPPGTPTFGATYLAPGTFDRVHWLLPERPAGSPRWHYWLSRSTPNLGSPVDLSTVDPMLKGTVALAQSRGVLTLPSCEGHFFDGERFDAQYRQLVADVPAIRAGTLRLRDVETGAVYRPRVPNWMPPEYEKTRSLLRCFSGIGGIGFSFPEPSRAALFAQFAAPVAAEVTQETRGGRYIVSVIVRGSTREELSGKWRAIASALECALGG